MIRRTGLATYAWGVLAFNVAVVLWGAFVRATGSGAGCGRHWPTCNGEVIPRAPGAATLIEFTHRATSGVALVLVVGLAVAVFRSVPRGAPARAAAAASLGLMIAEALLGAMLVLLRLVAHDQSLARGASVALHLTNTLLLLAALALTAAFASGLPRPVVRGNGAVVGLVAPALGLTLVLGVTGAIAALGDTLFPARSLAEGLAQDLSPGAHLFLRLRGLHPLGAIFTAGYVLLAAPVVRALRPTRATALLARALGVTVVAQVAVGVANVSLLAPVPLQLVHLLMADVVWLLLVLLGGATLAAPGAASAAGAVESGTAPTS